MVSEKTPMKILRRLTPPSGRPYELFDCSFLLAAMSVLGYVVVQTSTGSRQTLVDIFEYVPQNVFGMGIFLAGVFGVVASYTTRWLDKGYAVTIGACFFVAGVYAAGLVLAEFNYRSVVSILIYGWVARRLLREEGRDYCQYCFMDWKPGDDCQTGTNSGHP